MEDYSLAELQQIRQRTIEQLGRTRVVVKMLGESPTNSKLRLVSLRQIGSLLLGIDLIDAHIARRTKSTVHQYWTPKL
jgi:hypothetical protein